MPNKTSPPESKPTFSFQIFIQNWQGICFREVRWKIHSMGHPLSWSLKKIIVSRNQTLDFSVRNQPRQDYIYLYTFKWPVLWGQLFTSKQSRIQSRLFQSIYALKEICHPSDWLIFNRNGARLWFCPSWLIVSYLQSTIFLFYSFQATWIFRVYAKAEKLSREPSLSD